MEYSIANDYDPNGDMPATADCVAEYLTYLAEFDSGAVGDMGFMLEDFRRYIEGRR